MHLPLSEVMAPLAGKLDQVVSGLEPGTGYVLVMFHGQDVHCVSNHSAGAVRWAAEAVLTMTKPIDPAETIQ